MKRTLATFVLVAMGALMMGGRIFVDEDPEPYAVCDDWGCYYCDAWGCYDYWCESDWDCPSGTYCAMDGVCYDSGDGGPDCCEPPRSCWSDANCPRDSVCNDNGLCERRGGPAEGEGEGEGDGEGEGEGDG